MSLIKKRIHRRIIDKKRRLNNIQPLPPNLAESLKKDLTINYIYNSNAIEGSKLTLNDTRLIIEEFYR